MKLSFETITDQYGTQWHYVKINGRRDRIGYSSLPAVGRRYRAILDGFI